MKRLIYTLGLLLACTVLFAGCQEDKPNPVDENVPETEIKQGESVNPDDLDLFKDDSSKGEEAKDKEQAEDADKDGADAGSDGAGQ